MAAVLQTFTSPVGHARPPVGVTPVICPCDPYALWVCWLPDTCELIPFSSTAVEQTVLRK